VPANMPAVADMTAMGNMAAMTCPGVAGSPGVSSRWWPVPSVHVLFHVARAPTLAPLG
jgi:hypothetical protein